MTVENALCEGAGQAEAQERQEEKALTAVSRWIAAHPRAVVWAVIGLLIPYLALCWGATFTVVAALMGGGGCGG